MDVGTVKKKLDSPGVYKSPLEVRDDLRLVWKNCATYNPPGHPVRNMGDILAAAWENAWAESNMENRWNQHLLQKDPKGLALPHRVNQLSSQVRSTVQSAQVGGEPDPSQQMSDIEKRKLSVELSELQGDQLLEVLDVLQADLSGRAEEEVELDMDTLPNDTLWRLHAYVRSLSRRAVPQAGAPNKTAAAVAEAPAGAASRPAPEGPGAAAAGGPGTAAAPGAAGGAAVANGGEGVRADGHAAVGEKGPPSTSRQREGDLDMEEAEGSQGSDSKSDSHQEFKGSTMDDPSTQNAPQFPKDRRVVDESATGAAEQSTILKEKAGSRKPEVQVNAANWNVSALQQPEGNENEENEEAADDEVWKQFQTMDEQKRKQAEDQKKLKEQQEQEMLRVKEAEQEAARKVQQEAEERERKLKEEEERVAQEQQRARMEQCDKEVDEIKARQGTANLIQQNDMQSALMQQPGGNGGLAAVGLVYKNEDEEVNFDDE
uniref:NET domain-containing protein n=1 Tax=Dunaliella tertiolecta TaxID=3047 RepID=A0A7S3QN04_DUNTE